MQCGNKGSVTVELQMEQWLKQASRAAHSAQSMQPTALPARLQPTPGGAMLLQPFVMDGMHAVDDIVVVERAQESLMLRSAKVRQGLNQN